MVRRKILCNEYFKINKDMFDSLSHVFIFNIMSFDFSYFSWLVAHGYIDYEANLFGVNIQNLINLTVLLSEVSFDWPQGSGLLLTLSAFFLLWVWGSPCFINACYPSLNEFKSDPFGVFRTSKTCDTVSWLGEAEKMLPCSPAFTR